MLLIRQITLYLVILNFLGLSEFVGGDWIDQIVIVLPASEDFKLTLLDNIDVSDIVALTLDDLIVLTTNCFCLLDNIFDLKSSESFKKWQFLHKCK